MNPGSRDASPVSGISRADPMLTGVGGACSIDVGLDFGATGTNLEPKARSRSGTVLSEAGALVELPLNCVLMALSLS